MSSEAEASVAKSKSLTWWRFLLEWFALTVVIGPLLLSAISLLGSEALLWVGGLGLIILGLLQGIVLQRHVRQNIWNRWALATALAWLPTIPVIIICGLLVLAGAGLNGLSDAELQGALLYPWVLSGGLYATLRYLVLTPRKRPAGLFLLDLAAWLAAGIVGPFASLNLFPKYNFAYILNAYSPYNNISTAVGIFVGFAVYGLVLGTGIARSLPQLRQSQG